MAGFRLDLYHLSIMSSHKCSFDADSRQHHYGTSQQALDAA